MVSTSNNVYLTDESCYTRRRTMKAWKQFVEMT